MVLMDELWHAPFCVPHIQFKENTHEHFETR